MSNLYELSCCPNSKHGTAVLNHPSRPPTPEIGCQHKLRSHRRLTIIPRSSRGVLVPAILPASRLAPTIVPGSCTIRRGRCRGGEKGADGGGACSLPPYPSPAPPSVAARTGCSPRSAVLSRLCRGFSLSLFSALCWFFLACKGGFFSSNRVARLSGAYDFWCRVTLSDLLLNESRVSLAFIIRLLSPSIPA